MRILILISILTTLSQAAEPARAFPDSTHTYTKEEVCERLSPLFLPAVEPLFNDWLDILFSGKLGKPAHPNSVIVQCWNCFHNRLTESLDLAPEERIEQQNSMIYMDIAMHQGILKKKVPEFFQKIESHLPF